MYFLRTYQCIPSIAKNPPAVLCNIFPECPPYCYFWYLFHQNTSSVPPPRSREPIVGLPFECPRRKFRHVLLTQHGWQAPPGCPCPVHPASSLDKRLRQHGIRLLTAFILRPGCALYLSIPAPDIRTSLSGSAPTCALPSLRLPPRLRALSSPAWPAAHTRHSPYAASTFGSRIAFASRADMVESADPVCNRMHISDIGIGKRDPSPRRAGQHVHPRLFVLRLTVSRQEDWHQSGAPPSWHALHLRGTEPVAVCLHRVRQRIHPAVGSHIRRQGTAKSRIEKRIARYETVIHDGMLIVACLIRDDSRQRHLRAGSRRRRHRKKKRQLFVS